MLQILPRLLSCMSLETVDLVASNIEIFKDSPVRRHLFWSDQTNYAALNSNLCEHVVL